jgi:hypothetical protein
MRLKLFVTKETGKMHILKNEEKSPSNGVYMIIMVIRGSSIDVCDVSGRTDRLRPRDRVHEKKITDVHF